MAIPVQPLAKPGVSHVAGNERVELATFGSARIVEWTTLAVPQMPFTTWRCSGIACTVPVHET